MGRLEKGLDNRIGEIVSAVEEAGIKEDTVFMILGDHGQKSIHKKVYLNTLFRKKGLIYEEKGQLIWRAFVQGAGGSAGILKVYSLRTGSLTKSDNINESHPVNKSRRGSSHSCMPESYKDKHYAENQYNFIIR